MTHKRCFVTDENGKTKCHDRQVWPHVETLRQFIHRVYGYGRKLVISTEKQRPGEFCRPYTMMT